MSAGAFPSLGCGAAAPGASDRSGWISPAGARRRTGWAGALSGGAIPAPEADQPGPSAPPGRGPIRRLRRQLDRHHVIALHGVAPVSPMLHEILPLFPQRFRPKATIDGARVAFQMGQLQFDHVVMPDFLIFIVITVFFVEHCGKA